MAKILKGLGIPVHPKAKPIKKTPLAGTRKGMAGITPVGVTGTGNITKHGMKGGKIPAMRPGGRSKGHQTPISFAFPSMRSATTAHSMGGYGAQDGGMVGINPPFKAGKVAGRRAKNQRSTKPY